MPPKRQNRRPQQGANRRKTAVPTQAGRNYPSNFGPRKLSYTETGRVRLCDVHQRPTFGQLETCDLSRLSLMSTRLGQTMRLWEYWVPRRVQAVYVPAVDFTAPGTLSMYWETDPRQIILSSHVEGATRILDNALSVSTPISQGIACTMPPTNKKLFCNPSLEEWRKSCAGKIVWNVVGSGKTAYNVIGHIDIVYEIEFRVPQHPSDWFTSDSSITTLTSTNALDATTSPIAEALTAINANSVFKPGTVMSARIDCSTANDWYPQNSALDLAGGERIFIQPARAVYDDAADTWTELASTYIAGTMFGTNGQPLDVDIPGVGDILHLIHALNGR